MRSPKTRNRLTVVVLAFILHGLLNSALGGFAQDAPSESAARTSDEGATVKGQIVVAESGPVTVDLTSIPVQLAERLTYKPLPLPPDWETQNADQRRAWIEAFQASDAGKAFVAEREAALAAQRKFEIQLDADGQFELFDVPPGSYQLFGNGELDSDGRHYLAEVFAQIEVEAVDELILQPLPLEITRQLMAGESAPSLDVVALKPDGPPLPVDTFGGKPLLMHFWAAGHPSVAQDFSGLRQIYSALHADEPLEILSVCVDEQPDAALQLVSAEEIPWPQGHAPGWNHPFLKAFGVRSVPALFLMDPAGKIALCDADFIRAAMQGQSDQVQIIRDALRGSPDSDSDK